LLTLVLMLMLMLMLILVLILLMLMQRLMLTLSPGLVLVLVLVLVLNAGADLYGCCGAQATSLKPFSPGHLGTATACHEEATRRDPKRADRSAARPARTT
jgi:hypothetical protein